MCAAGEESSRGLQAKKLICFSQRYKEHSVVHFVPEAKSFEKYRILFNEMSDMTAEQECEIFPCLAIHPSFSRYQKLGSHWLQAKRLF